MTDPTRLPGHITWRELTTPDPDEARAFYGEVLGWGFTSAPMEGGDPYEMAVCGDKEVAGLMRWDAPGPASWGAYFSTLDVDAAAAAVETSGGTLVHGPSDIPGMGRFAVVTDPEGATFMIVHWSAGDPSGPPTAPGEPCWETLYTPDPAAIAPFYRDVLGLHLSDDGPEGVQVFATDQGMAADVEATAGDAPAHWLCWFIAPGGLAATRQRAIAAGGTVVRDGLGVPGVGNMAILRDRQGAIFGIFEGVPS